MSEQPANAVTTKVGEGKEHRARVAGATRRQKKLDNKLVPPGVVNPARALDEGTNRFADGPDWQYPVAATHAGRWTRPDPRDTDMRIREELTLDRDGKRTTATPFGQLSVGPEVIDYLKDKKEQEAYLNEIKLAEYLEDGSDPMTIEYLKEIYPEFRSVPEEYHRTQLAVQEALRTILRDGKIRGRDDNALIAKIIREDYLIPVFPAWDPNGIFIGDLPPFNRLTKAGLNMGLFNPRQWAVGNPATDAFANDSKPYSNAEMKGLQAKLKRMILRRVYPGLRKLKDADLNAAMGKVSPVTGVKTGNEALGFYNLVKENAMIKAQAQVQLQ